MFCLTFSVKFVSSVVSKQKILPYFTCLPVRHSFPCLVSHLCPYLQLPSDQGFPQTASLYGVVHPFKQLYACIRLLGHMLLPLSLGKSRLGGSLCTGCIGSWGTSCLCGLYPRFALVSQDAFPLFFLLLPAFSLYSFVFSVSETLWRVSKQKMCWIQFDLFFALVSRLVALLVIVK